MFNWIDDFMKIFGFNRAEFNEIESAVYIGRSVSTLRAYRGSREYKRVPEIPFHKKGSRYYYWRDDLDKWMESRGW